MPTAKALRPSKLPLVDVEVIATILEFTAHPLDARRAISLLGYRLVCGRWKTAVATALQRKLEQAHQRSSDATETPASNEEPLYGKPRREGLSWSCSSKSELRPVYVCAKDFCQNFFEALSGVSIPKCRDWELSWILNTCPNLGKLELEAFDLDEPSPQTLESIGKLCPKLKMVGFGYNCRFSEAEVVCLLSQLTQVEALQLSRAKSCSDSIFSVLLSHNYRLTSFIINGFPLRRQQALIDFLESQGTLQHLEAPSIRRLGDRSMDAIGRCCPNLTHLDVSWCPRVSGKGVLAATRQCPKLKRLRVMGVDEVGEETLNQLSLNCPDLFLLSMCRETLTKGRIEGLGKCTKLRSLDLYSTPTEEEALLWLTTSGLSKLQHLNVTDGTLTNKGLAQLAQGCGSSLTTCYFRDVSGFSEAGMILFVEQCSRLVRLCITCDVIGDAFLKALALLPGRVFQSLELSSQKQITAEGLQLFLRSPSARRLHSLSLDKIVAVDDSVLRCIADAECGECIAYLSVGHTSVTDEGLMYLISKCPASQTLDVSSDKYKKDANSGKVTDKFVDFLVQRKSEISVGYVNFFGCKEVSAAALSRLLKAYPELLISTDFSDAEIGVRRKGSRPDPPPSPKDGSASDDDPDPPSPTLPQAIFVSRPSALATSSATPPPPPVPKKEKSCVVM